MIRLPSEVGDRGRSRSIPASPAGRRTHWLVVGVLAATVAAMVLAVAPRRFAEAMARFNPRVVPAVLGLSIVIFLFQGLRWHGLLRQAGVRLGLGDSVLLNTAGQAITAILPLGDLTRAILASRAARANFGTVAATVTVQELAYSLVLVVAAGPVLILTRHGVWILLAVLAGIVVVLALLTVGRLFCLVHRLVARTPLLRRLLGQIEGLHQETAMLLHRPETTAWSVLDAARGAAAISIVWLIVEGLDPGALGWWQAAFVLSLSSLGGAISLIPGGAGASEASTVGLLLLFDVDPATAAAAALMQRLVTTGLPSLFGWGAYAVARRRFELGSMLELPPAVPRAAPCEEVA